MKRLVLLTFILSSLLPLGAQNDVIRWRNYSTDDGLPDNSVRSIFQDSDGLLWLCTREGICMYDGLHFKQLEDPSCSLLDGLAMSLAEDPQHRLWFITTRGIGFYDLGTGEIRTVRVNTSGGLIGAADIAVDRNGLVWFANEDIFCWDPSREVLVDYSPIALFHSNTVEADSNGSVWFLTTSGDLHRFNPITNSFEQIHRGSGERFSRQDLVSDGRDHMLFSAPDGVVLSTDIFTNVTTVFCRTDISEIRCIIPEREGRIWLGTNHGILLMDGSSTARETSGWACSTTACPCTGVLRPRSPGTWGAAPAAISPGT